MKDGSKKPNSNRFKLIFVKVTSRKTKNSVFSLNFDKFTSKHQIVNFVKYRSRGVKLGGI